MKEVYCASEAAPGVGKDCYIGKRWIFKQTDASDE